jgi:hypothetical protein
MKPGIVRCPIATVFMRVSPVLRGLQGTSSIPPLVRDL